MVHTHIDTYPSPTLASARKQNKTSHTSEPSDHATPLVHPRGIQACPLNPTPEPA